MFAAPNIENLCVIELVLVGSDKHAIIPGAQRCFVGVSAEAESSICSSSPSVYGRAAKFGTVQQAHIGKWGDVAAQDLAASRLAH